MTWDPNAARGYLWDLARDLGGEGHEHECDILRSSSGAAYWAADQGIGIGSRKEFLHHLMHHVGWSEETAEDAADEVAASSALAKEAAKDQEKEALSRFDRVSPV